MRGLITGITLGFLCGATSVLAGQEKPSSAPVRTAPHREERATSVGTSAEHLIYQRAILQARNRMARTENRKWLGVSAQRPSLPLDAFQSDLNGSTWFPGWNCRNRPVWPGR